MGLFTLLIWLPLVSPSFAGGLRVERDPHTHNIYLIGTQCEEIKKQVEDFRAWTQKRGETPAPLAVDCDTHPMQGEVHLNISSILPQFVRDVTGKFVACDGANCHNTALVEQKLAFRPRYSTGNEFIFYRENYCREVRKSPSESPQAGDLVSIRKRQGDGKITEIHGLTYLGQMGFTKNGLNKINPFQILDLEDIFKLYKVDSKPECRDGSFSNIGDCKIFVEYHRCEPPGLRHPLPIPLAELESRISSCVLRGSFQGNFPFDLDQMESTILVLWKEVGKLPRGDTTSLNRTRFLETTLESYHQQLMQLSFWDVYDKLINPNFIPRKDKLSMVLDEGNSYVRVALEKDDRVRLEHLMKLKSEHGMDIHLELTDRFGQTPLHIAAGLEKFEAAELLVENGASVNAKNSDGNSPLHMAVKKKNFLITELLLDNGAKMNQQNKEGVTALHLAVDSENEELIRYLLSRGANPNIEDNEGETPLAWAVDTDNAEVVKILLEEGKADPTHVNKNGISVIQMAKEEGSSGVLSLLLKKAAHSVGEAADEDNDSQSPPKKPRPDQH